MKTYGGFLMSQIRHLSGRAFDKILREDGVYEFSGAQGRILYVLWENERLTITDISRLTSLAKTTLTAMLDKMESDGLVRRERDTVNRRQIFIRLTEKSQNLRGAYDRVSERINEIFYRGFTADEVAFFEDTLRRIVTNFEEASK